MKPVARIFRPPYRTLLTLLVGLQLSMPLAAASLDDLLNAAKMGDAAAVTRMVSQGMDINSTDQNGNSLLILAAREDQARVVEALVKQRGIKGNARPGAGDSARMVA
ncbi:MAG: ankyrin repeat domain-containing protein, partial [Zoogloea sp.]